MTTSSDQFIGGTGTDRVLYLGGDKDRRGFDVPDFAAVTYNIGLHRYEFSSLVWDIGQQKFRTTFIDTNGDRSQQPAELTVYEQQYLYYQTRDVENTQFVTRSGNDVVHADPGFQFLPILASGQGFVLNPAANAASFDEYGIKPGHFEQGATEGAIRIDGGEGNDFLFGGVLDDTLEGGGGNDYLVGNLGNDNLFGGGGADQIFGHSPAVGTGLTAYPVAPQALPQGFPSGAASEPYVYDLAAPFLNLPSTARPGVTLTSGTISNFDDKAFGLDGSAPGERLSNLTEVGDFNGDGQTDFLASGVNQSYLLFGPINLENFASVAPQSEIIIDQSALGRPAERFGDINGDGRADLVFVKNALNRTEVTVIFGNPTAGTNTLAQTVLWPRTWNASFASSVLNTTNSRKFTLDGSQLSPNDVKAQVLNHNGDHRADLLLSAPTTAGTLAVAETVQVDGTTLAAVVASGTPFVVTGSGQLHRGVFVNGLPGGQVTSLPGVVTQNSTSAPITAMNGVVYVQSISNGIADIFRVDPVSLTATNITNRTGAGVFQALYSLKTSSTGDSRSLYAVMRLDNSDRLFHVDENNGTMTLLSNLVNVKVTSSFLNAPINNSLKFVTGPSNSTNPLDHSLVWFDPQKHGQFGATRTITLQNIQSSGPVISDINQFVESSVLDDNFLYLPATSATTGRELWRVDLTTPTAPVSNALEILPGPNSSSAGDFGDKRIALADGVVYFTATGGPEGQQLWRYVPNSQNRLAIGTISRVLNVNQQGIGDATELISGDTELLLQRGADFWRFDGVDFVRLATNTSSADMNTVLSGTNGTKAVVNSSPGSDSLWMLHNNPLSILMTRYGAVNAGYVFGGQAIEGNLPLLSGLTSVDVAAAEFTIRPESLGLASSKSLDAVVVGDVNGDGRDDIVFTGPGNLTLNRQQLIKNDVATRKTVKPTGNPLDSIDALLANSGIANDDTFESAASSFIVPGSSGLTSLTFTLKADKGANSFTFGYFDASLIAFDPITERQQFAVAAISQAVTQNTVIFNDIADNPGSTATRSIPAGTQLGFFLIPDNTAANFLASPASFYPAADAPLFSFPNANPANWIRCWRLLETARRSLRLRTCLAQFPIRTCLATLTMILLTLHLRLTHRWWPPADLSCIRWAT